MEEKLKKLKRLKITNIILFIMLIVGIIIIGVEISIWNNNACENEIHGDVLDDTKREIQKFNASLEHGIGANVIGNKVRIMIGSAIEMLNNNPDLELTINEQNTIEGIEEIRNEIIPTKIYNVVEAGYDKNGRINKIIITEKAKEVTTNDKTN